MREMVVRELKRSLSATLRAVAEASRCVWTMRGGAIADIVPARASKLGHRRAGSSPRA